MQRKGVTHTRRKGGLCPDKASGGPVVMVGLIKASNNRRVKVKEKGEKKSTDANLLSKINF